MKTKTQLEQKCKYIVQPEKRKVICILNDTSHMFLNYVWDNIPINITGFWGDRALERKMLMPARFVGIATCAPEDEFDEEFGRKLAYKRAKDKVDVSFFKRANLFIALCDEKLDEAAYKLNKLGYQMSKNAEHRDEVIANMLGEANGVSQNK